MPFTPDERRELDDGLYDIIRHQCRHPGDMPFICAIFENPDDPLSRNVFADHLYELGRDAESFGQRWAAATLRKPLDCRVDRRRVFGGWYNGTPTDARYYLPYSTYSRHVAVEQSRGHSLEDLLMCEVLLLQNFHERGHDEAEALLRGIRSNHARQPT